MSANELSSVLARRVIIYDATGSPLQHSWAVGQVVVWKLPHEEHLWLAETSDRREGHRRTTGALQRPVRAGGAMHLAVSFMGQPERTLERVAEEGE